MRKENAKEYIYAGILQKSLIVALSFMIILFYLFPRFDRETKLPAIEIYPEIIVYIPRTVQKTRERLPKPVKPVIPVAADELEILEEVTIQPDSVRSLPGLQLLDGAYSSNDLSYLPRQILEVLPKRVPGVQGKIVLSLKIDIDGKVADYKIKENSTRSAECLTNVLEAARKSRWEAMRFENQKVLYWIDKTYLFGQDE